MSKSKIVVVVPTIRFEMMKQFRAAWATLFEKHEVTLITVWDGEDPRVEVTGSNDKDGVSKYNNFYRPTWLCRFTDAVRNLGFLVAANLKPDFVLTLDDDVLPLPGDENDPIQAHLTALSKRVNIEWLNTAHRDSPMMRGVPYLLRQQNPVMLSHGVWVGVPDLDGETQLDYEKRGFVPQVLPYYCGPVPKGSLFPLCGMNVMVAAQALPYFYFAPMGKDSGVEGLHRFGDIWMGNLLKKTFDRLGWACYTGLSTVIHSRASNAEHNFSQEKLGREWNEVIPWDRPHDPPATLPGKLIMYLNSYHGKRTDFYQDIDQALRESR